MNECIMTHQPKNALPIECQTNGIYKKKFNTYGYETKLNSSLISKGSHFQITKLQNNLLNGQCIPKSVALWQVKYGNILETLDEYDPNVTHHTQVQML